MGNTKPKQDPKSQTAKKSRFSGWDLAGESKRTGHDDYFDSIFAQLPPEMLAGAASGHQQREAQVEEKPSQPEENEQAAEPSDHRGPKDLLPVKPKDQKELTFPKNTPPGGPLAAVKIHPLKIITQKQGGDASPPPQPLPTRVHDESANTEAVVPSFIDFKTRWAPFINNETVMKVCEVLFNKTHAAGREELTTTYHTIATETGITERYSYSIIKRLVSLRFVEKLELTGGRHNKKGEGIRIKFYLSPKV